MFLNLMEQGGPVLWIILISGAVAFLVYVERSLHLHRARIKAEDFLKGIFNILHRGNTAEALTICEETPGPVAQLVRTGILNRHEDRELLRSSMEDVSLAEISRMERRLVVIATVAQVAPLLGLLGTFIGLVDALLVMQNQTPLIQTIDITGALLRALITTAAGLSVAIPCYVAFNLLVVKIDRIVLDMEKAIAEVVAFLTGAKARGEGSPAP